MPTHIETLLTSIGLPAEDVASIVALPEEQQATFDAKPFVEKVKTNYQTQLQNDPAFYSDATLEKLPAEVKKKLETTQYGRASHVVRQKFLKVLGMSEDDFADLPEDKQKELESFIPAVTERWSKNKAADPALQQKYIDAMRKVEELQGQEETIKTKYETEANQKVTNAIFNAVLLGELSALPGLKIPATDLATTAGDIIRSKYGYERVSDLVVELRQKENPKLKALHDGSAKEITMKDAVTAIAKERGWITEEGGEGGGKGSGKMKVTPSAAGLEAVVAPHLRDKISQKIAAEQ